MSKISETLRKMQIRISSRGIMLCSRAVNVVVSYREDIGFEPRRTHSLELDLPHKSVVERSTECQSIPGLPNLIPAIRAAPAAAHA